MRPIWILAIAASLLPGCASWFQRSVDHYPDADLGRFAPAAVGARWEADLTMPGVPMSTWLEVKQVEQPAGKPRLATVEAGTRAGEGEIKQGMREWLYPDRIEQQLEGEDKPHVELRTPLKAGTKWDVVTNDPKRPHQREILGVEDVCTGQAFFRNALVVQDRYETGEGAKLAVHVRKTWFVPDVGMVQSKAFEADSEQVSALKRFVPAAGKPPMSFDGCK